MSLSTDASSLLTTLWERPKCCPSSEVDEFTRWEVETHVTAELMKQLPKFTPVLLPSLGEGPAPQYIGETIGQSVSLLASFEPKRRYAKQFSLLKQTAFESDVTIVFRPEGLEAIVDQRTDDLTKSLLELTGIAGLLIRRAGAIQYDAGSDRMRVIFHIEGRYRACVHVLVANVCENVDGWGDAHFEVYASYGDSIILNILHVPPVKNIDYKVAGDVGNLVAELLDKLTGWGDNLKDALSKLQLPEQSITSGPIPGILSVTGKCLPDRFLLVMFSL